MSLRLHTEKYQQDFMLDGKKTGGSIVCGALWQAVHYDWLDNIKALFHEVVFVCKKVL